MSLRLRYRSCIISRLAFLPLLWLERYTCWLDANNTWTCYAQNNLKLGAADSGVYPYLHLFIPKIQEWNPLFANF